MQQKISADGFREGIHWVWPLPRIPVTTRIITFLVGNPDLNLYLPLLLGRGKTPKVIQSSHGIFRNFPQKILWIFISDTKIGDPTSEKISTNG